MIICQLIEVVVTLDQIATTVVVVIVPLEQVKNCPIHQVAKPAVVARFGRAHFVWVLLLRRQAQGKQAFDQVKAEVEETIQQVVVLRVCKLLCLNRQDYTTGKLLQELSHC